MENTKQTGPEKNSSHHIIVKHKILEKGSVLLKNRKREAKIKYNNKYVKITAGFPMETLSQKALEWCISSLKKTLIPIQMIIPGKTVCSRWWEKTYHDINRLKEFKYIKLRLQRILEWTL